MIQFIGYLVYYQKSIKGSVEPNPLTWLMFAYGTMILFVLEFDQGASVSELILPAVCSACGVGIAVRIWIIAFRKDGTLWPSTWRIERNWEGRSFACDLILTAAYLAAWGLTLTSWLSEGERLIASLVFLFLANATTFTAFLPVLKQAWQAPRTEHWLPWAVWTMSYGLLVWVTAVESEVMLPTNWNVLDWKYDFWTWVALMIYPVSNALLHGLVAVFACPRRQQLAEETEEAVMLRAE
ncbi:MAG TPA: hypothetical protein PKA42_02810 [Candidatus Paceibacterota bacterium]|nr:hypothetical protein [Candidatus Paceibacterota bacterium]